MSGIPAKSAPPARAAGPGPRRAGNVAWRVLEGSAVLVAPSSPTVRTLNEVGTRVWELCDGRPVAELVDAVVNEFEVSRTQAESDVGLFLRRLLDESLLVASASGTDGGEHGAG